MTHQQAVQLLEVLTDQQKTALMDLLTTMLEQRDQPEPTAS